MEPTLLLDKDFKRAFQKTLRRSFIKVRRIDRGESFYYIVPFDKNVRGELLTSLAIIVDAERGYFKEVLWVKKPVRYVIISKKEAIKLVLKETGFSHNGQIEAELVWEPCGVSYSPFFPFWKVIVDKEDYFVTYDGGKVIGDRL